MIKKSNNRTNNFPAWLSLIPPGIGILFAALMVYLGVVSSEKARDHYRGKRFQEIFEKVKAPEVPKIDFPKLPELSGDKTTPTPTAMPTPKPSPTPKPETNWREKMEDYEIEYPLEALPVLLFGLALAFAAFRKFPARSSENPTFSMASSLLIMCSFFAVSFALLILYLWALRIGLLE